jgi:2-oxo-4-hydroxy-4-carboxy-5-ureidoimidazoline decarboxylase
VSVELPEESLRACLAVPRWVEAVRAAEPDEVFAVAERVAATLTAEEIAVAVADHPRIGDRTGGATSRAEQSGVDNPAEFLAANREYEQRFGRIYLVCASGRGGDELLADLRARLGNDPDTELAVTARELGKIALLRLAKVVS